MNATYRRLFAILIMAGLLLSACKPKSPTVEKIQPIQLEPIEGSDFQRLVLTEKAAERLDIQTVPVREEQIVRKLTVGGQIVTASDGSAATAAPDIGSAIVAGIKGAVMVRVPLRQDELNMIDRSKPVLIQSLDDEEDFDDETEGLIAELDEGLADDDLEDDALCYMMNSGEQVFLPGQGVLVELALSGGEMPQKVVPYAAVLYGVHGETWVYTNPEPLVFVRQPIVIDYIEGDLAVLSEGPQAGTAIVTVGAAELFGAETGVSK